jgi:hypothetical protein
MPVLMRTGRWGEADMQQRAGPSSEPVAGQQAGPIECGSKLPHSQARRATFIAARSGRSRAVRGRASCHPE